MKVIIDRFEEDTAVLELPDGTMLNVPKKLFCEAHEGDTVTITVDTAQTEEKSNQAHSIFERLRNKSKEQ